MAINAAGLDVSGQNNPRWKGGPVSKVCAVCGKSYTAKRANIRSQFCSLRCVGISQRGTSSRKTPPRVSTLRCEVCRKHFSVPASHAKRHKCCSKACSFKRRSIVHSGDGNPNWSGGLSRLPYPWNFKSISRRIIERDGRVCQNPSCSGFDGRLTSHHIDYDKNNCDPENLITLCSTCNSKANFNREQWTRLYRGLIALKKTRQGWETESF